VSTKTSPINPWGLYDMLGNVAEWVEDCYVVTYEEAPKDGSSALVQPCIARVVRGGSWGSLPRVVRAALRNGIAPVFRSSHVGFRLVRTASP